MEAALVTLPSSVSAPSEARAGRRAALALAALAGATVAWGLIAKATGTGLGTPLPPFFLSWAPQVEPGGLIWIALFAACVALAVPLARGFGSPSIFVIGVTALGSIGRLSLAAASGKTGAWYSVFGSDPEAANEYLPALPALDLGTRTFLDRFAELAPSLPIHPSAHPPGLLLTINWLGIDDSRSFAALVIAAGILSLPLTYLAARRLAMEEGRARAAALMLAFSPAAMLYGVASADALFATLGLATAILLVSGGLATRIVGMIALALASLFSWALLAIGAFATLLVAQREGLRRAVSIALGAGLALLIFYGLLHAATGYDPIGFLAAADDAYALGISNARPWAFYVLGSPAAFFLMLGLPIAWYAARALGIANTVAVAVAGVVVIAALLGYSKAETERIWLFLGPLACLAAAAIVPRERVPAVIALLGAQALFVELTMETIW